METYFDDKEFGRVHIRMTARAKHYSIKITKGEIWGIIPIDGDVNKLVDFIQSKRKEIKAILTKRPAPSLIDEQTVMQTATFQLRIFRTERENFYMKLDDEILSIACPNDTDFKKESVQDLLKNMIVRALRHYRIGETTWFYLDGGQNQFQPDTLGKLHRKKKRQSIAASYDIALAFD